MYWMTAREKKRLFYEILDSPRKPPDSPPGFSPHKIMGKKIEKRGGGWRKRSEEKMCYIMLCIM